MNDADVLRRESDPCLFSCGFADLQTLLIQFQRMLKVALRPMNVADVVQCMRNPVLITYLFGDFLAEGKDGERSRKISLSVGAILA